MLASRLFDLPIAVSEMDPRAVEEALSAGERLFPIEEAAVARAVDKRRREFTAGRTCARRAMAALGYPPAPVVQGEDRAPIWPEGLVGTITHTHSWCAVAVARASDGVRALGLDVEPDEPIRAELFRTICLPEERAELDEQPAEARGRIGKVIFSAKECAYKCQYALSRTLFGFHGMRVHLDLAGGTFVAVFQRDAGPFVAGDELRGRLSIDQGFVMTAMVL